MTYTVGSLFAGIGGFDLGFERAGFKTSWQVEIDPYCTKVLAKNFPEAERFGDIRECGSHNLKPVDVICGGFPCQDISTSGRGLGLDGERSGLWFQMLRIIRELRPRYVLIENVSALVGRGLDVVLCGLASLRFNAEWEPIPAAAAGAPHLRERTWILAYADGERQPQPRRCGDAFSEETNPYREADWLVNFIQRGTVPYVCRRHDGIPRSVDRLRGLGNSVVPQIPEMEARRIKQALEAA